MRIALVHDDLIQFGGAEKLLLAMHELWPEAPVYTSMATRDWVGKCRHENITLRTSFMKRLPFKKQLYKAYFLLFPLAFESFTFDEFDVVISSSARFAHGIVTKPETIHICYMNTPGRMWWEPAKYFGRGSFLKWFLGPFLSYLRRWDFVAAQRVDYFIANSKTPQERIKKYFGRDSRIIYPFAKTLVLSYRSPGSPTEVGAPRMTGIDSGYFLVVTRLVSWKRVGIAIEACKNLGQNLVIVGEGPDRRRLRQVASGFSNIKFLGRVAEETLNELYRNCQAVIITQEEDFGIVAVEAASFCKPVIAYKDGGSLEIVKEGLTGTFFGPQTVAALSSTLVDFDIDQYRNPKAFDDTTHQFSKDRFTGDLRKFVEKVYARKT